MPEILGPGNFVNDMFSIYHRKHYQWGYKNSVAVSMQPGIIHDTRIDSNIISNMATQGDWSTEMNYFEPSLVIYDKTGE